MLALPSFIFKQYKPKQVLPKTYGSVFVPPVPIFSSFILAFPPTTSNLQVGLGVPIPTLTASTAVPPSTKLLLVPTFALYPIAVALCRFPETTSAAKPIAVLLFPLVLLPKVFAPIAVLLSPKLAYKEYDPIPVFKFPEPPWDKALKPNAAF